MEKKKVIVLLEEYSNIVKYLANIQYALWYAENTDREVFLAFSDYDNVRKFKKLGWEEYLFNDVNKLYNTEYIVDIELFKDQIIIENPPLTLTDDIVYIKGNYTNYNYYHNGYIINKINIDNTLYDKIKNAYKDIYDFSETNVSLYVEKPVDIEEKNQLRKVYKTIVKQFPTGGVRYLVISNDIKWCKENLVGDAFVFMNRDIDNFDKDFINIIIQTMCDHNILGNNLVSWWGAYLNKHKNKSVFYQYPWEPYNSIIDDSLGWKKVKFQEKYNVALCVLCSVNHIHTFDWITYYKKLGISHIYMYNFADTDELPNEILQYFIDKNYVTLFNTTGMKLYTACYSDCYKKFGNLYDWMGFLNIEDFLIMPNKIKFLYDNLYKDYHSIKIARQEYIALEEDVTEFDLDNYSIKVSSTNNKNYICFVRTKINNIVITEYDVIFPNKNYKSCYIDGTDCASRKEYIYNNIYSKYIR